MPIRRQVCKVERVMRTHIEGVVTFDDIREHVLHVRRSGTHHYPEVIDARAVDGINWSPRDLIRLAHMARTNLGQHEVARRAVVVSSETHFGLARIFSSLVAGWMRVGVFTDSHSADAWLRGTPALQTAVDDRGARPAVAEA
jgi:hypothetical protein